MFVHRSRFQTVLACLIYFVTCCVTFGPLSTTASAQQIYRGRLDIHWLPGSASFWYRADGPHAERRFVFVDASRGIKEPAFDHAAVAKFIGDGVQADKLPVTEIQYQKETLVLLMPGGTLEINRVTGEITDRTANVDSQLEHLNPLSTYGRSGISPNETQIVFRNELDRPVQLIWISQDGEQQPYKTLEPGKGHVQNTYDRHLWLVTGKNDEPLAAFRAKKQAAVAVIHREIEAPSMRDRRTTSRAKSASEVSVSPNGKHTVFVKNHKLWLRDKSGEEETRLTDAGTKEYSFHRDAIRDRAGHLRYGLADHPDTLPHVYWSPDSRRAIALRQTTVPEPRVHLIESAPDDQLQPKNHQYPYFKPGAELPATELYLIDVASPSARRVASVPNAFTMTHFRWSPDSQEFTYLVNERGHQRLRLVAIDGKSGDQKTLIDETSDTFIDYSRKTYLQVFDQSQEMIWMSERDGWNHLYLYDLSNGRVKNQITQGEWVVREVKNVDLERRLIWFSAYGIYPDQDPYHLHFCRIGFDGLGLTIFTQGDGTHEIEISPNNEYFIDRYQRVDLPPVHELRSTEDGSLICHLETADAREVLEAGYHFPERYVAWDRNHEFTIHGIIHRPKDFDPDKKYPVIENIYAGPHGQHVPKRFRPRYRHQQEIADRGFVVVQIDGRGTNWRAKAFHNTAWRNLADAGFPDRIAWMKAAAETRPWMDLSRVGIYGGSAGGQNAMRALLDHGDFYQVAVADCGCHDNRMDKIWWNEAWLGWPVGKQYEQSSNVVDAHKLQGHLLLTVGELDRNVDPSSTMQVVAALQKANKPFELMVFPGRGHGSGESDYGRKLRADFFVKHLLE